MSVHSRNKIFFYFIFQSSSWCESNHFSSALVHFMREQRWLSWGSLGLDANDWLIFLFIEIKWDGLIIVNKKMTYNYLMTGYNDWWFIQKNFIHKLLNRFFWLSIKHPTLMWNFQSSINDRLTLLLFPKTEQECMNGTKNDVKIMQNRTTKEKRYFQKTLLLRAKFMGFYSVIIVRRRHDHQTK